MSKLLTSGKVGDNFQCGGVFSAIFEVLNSRRIMTVKEWLKWKKNRENYMMTTQEEADIKYLQDRLFASLKIPKKFIDKYAT